MSRTGTSRVENRFGPRGPQARDRTEVQITSLVMVRPSNLVEESTQGFDQGLWLIALHAMAGSLDRDPASVRNCLRKPPRIFLAEDRAVAAPHDEGGAA